MIDTDKYEDAKKMVQDAGLIDENEGHPDIHYRKIVHLLAEVKRLQNIIDGIVIHLSEITTYSFGDDNPGDENAQWMHWRNTRQEVLDIIASDGIEEVKWT